MLGTTLTINTGVGPDYDSCKYAAKRLDLFHGGSGKPNKPDPADRNFLVPTN